MGRVPRVALRPFREPELHDKDLVIRMLRREEEIVRSDEGQDRLVVWLSLWGGEGEIDSAHALGNL